MATQKAADEDLSQVSLELGRSGIHHQFLQDTCRTLRQQRIVWDTYMKASMLDAQELESIKKYDSSPTTLTSAQMAAMDTMEAAKMFKLLLTLVQKISRTDTVQYLLCMMDTVVTGCPASVLTAVPQSTSAPALITFAPSDAQTPQQPTEQQRQQSIYAVLLKLLNKDDEFTQLQSAKIIAELFSVWHGMPNDDQLREYLTWCSTRMTDVKASRAVDIASQCVQVILRNSEYRQRVWNMQSVVKAVVDVLKNTLPTPQLQYQCILSLWLLSFITDAAAGLQKQFDITPVLLDISRNAIKEKVVRVCLATLRNMYDKAPEANMLPMVGHKVLPLCETFLTRKWADEEIKEDLAHLQTELSKNIASLSTWDEYASELRSGKLAWSPPHTSENFWKQNASKLNDKDYELLRVLARLLVFAASDPVCLAVACHDIGQYVKYCPQGKKLIQELGTKQQIMELMTHQNAEVRYQALLAVQNYMSNAWGVA